MLEANVSIFTLVEEELALLEDDALVEKYVVAGGAEDDVSGIEIDVGFDEADPRVSYITRTESGFVCGPDTAPV